jgi:hypothetical protein
MKAQVWAAVAVAAGFGVAVAGEARGWRDAGNVYAASPTVSSLYTDSNGVWMASVGSWSNASPVVMGSAVCTTSEPTTLACVDAASGRVLWKARNDVVDALSGEPAARAAAMVAEAEAAEAALGPVKRTYSSVQRDARSHPEDAALAAQVTELAAKMGSLKATIDAAASFRTPADKEIIGYASATPVTDGSRVYALFGNGVVSAFSSAGARAWSVWLGAHTGDMRGYVIGTAASPVLVDGLLIVPWDTLTAIDPATGEIRWQGGEYRDYGTPGVARVGGVSVLLLPDGRMVRARDGAVLQTGLGNLWYVGPVVDGAGGGSAVDVYYAGSTSNGHSRRDAGVAVTAQRLTADGAGGVRATERWSMRLPSQETLYAQPVLSEGILYVATHGGEVWGVSTVNGGVWYGVDLNQYLVGEVFASPIISGRSVIVVGATGIFQFGGTGTAWTTLGAGRVEDNVRATPVMVGNRMYLRSYKGLRALSF